VFANAPSTCIALLIEQSLEYNKKFFFQDTMIKEGQWHHQEGQGRIPVKKKRRRITKYVVKGRSWERDLQELLQESNMKGQTRDGFLSIKSRVH
jgi:hypothetical protein